eukprot:GHVS01105950.1.p1 GENE.GHVS01105950.1~~GHVS01105950.1.p1  ORF type:complete len:231 (+),score=28.65 GHVS01105950.1:104-796(+)
MVFFFQCSDPSYIVYMGKDKYENEELIKYGFPEDIWFHVDDLSSAHVYLRMPLDNSEIDYIPDVIVKEMAQLTKSNSIEGSKAAAVDVIYTQWSNLKKTVDMDVGQVGMKNPQLVKTVKRVSRDRVLLKQLEKTRTEEFPNLQEAREKRDQDELIARKKAAKEQRIRERDEAKEKEVCQNVTPCPKPTCCVYIQRQRQMRSYETVHANAPVEIEVSQRDDSRWTHSMLMC